MPADNITPLPPATSGATSVPPAAGLPFAGAIVPASLVPADVALLPQAELAGDAERLATTAVKDIALAKTLLTEEQHGGLIRLLPYVKQIESAFAETEEEVEEVVADVRAIGWKSPAAVIAIGCALGPVLLLAAGHAAPSSVTIAGMSVGALFAGMSAAITAFSKKS